MLSKKPAVHLFELVNEIFAPTGIERGFLACRFRPLDERKTDISFAHEILRKVSNKDRVLA